MHPHHYETDARFDDRLCIVCGSADPESKYHIAPAPVTDAVPVAATRPTHIDVVLNAPYRHEYVPEGDSLICFICGRTPGGDTHLPGPESETN